MSTIEKEIEIQLEYSPENSNASGLFLTYSKLISAVTNTELMLVKTISRNVKHANSLIEIRPGSIISKIKEQFEIDDSEFAKESEMVSDVVCEYINNGRNTIFDAMRAGPISTEKQIEDIRVLITTGANEKGISERFSYTPPSISEIIDSTKEMAGATSELREDETVILSEGTVKTELPKNVEVEVSKIERELSKKFVTTKRELILKVKKPDYLGEAKWEFKHGKNRVDANIEDEDWLERFHSKKAIIAPGDSLEVIIRLEEEYDKHGDLLKEEYAIEKVKEIIRGRIDE